MVPHTLFVSGAVATLQLIKEIYVRVQNVRRFRRDCDKLASFVHRIEKFIMETEDDADMTAPGWEAAFSALHEALLEVVAVFETCTKHGMIVSMINADSLNLRLNSVSQRLMLALQLIPIQKATATNARLSDLQSMQLDIRTATFTAVRAAEEQSAQLKRLMDQSRVDASKTQYMLAQVLSLLQADACTSAAAAAAAIDGDSSDPPEPSAPPLDAATLAAEMADLRAEMEQAVADKNKIEQQYLEQVIAAITAMENAMETQTQTEAAVSEKEPTKSEELSVPSDLRCPISYELLVDPVILVDSAQTYERAAIQEWLSRGNRKDPISGVQLESTVLVPNIAIRKMAQDWLQANPTYKQQQEQQSAAAAAAAAAAEAAVAKNPYPYTQQKQQAKGGSSSSSMFVDRDKPGMDVCAPAAKGKAGSGDESASDAQFGQFSIDPKTAAVLEAAARAAAAGSSSSSYMVYSAATSTAANEFEYPDLKKPDLKADLKADFKANLQADFKADLKADLKPDLTTRQLDLKHSKSEPVKGGKSDDAIARDSFSLGDLHATLTQTAATREQMREQIAATKQRGLFSSKTLPVNRSGSGSSVGSSSSKTSDTRDVGSRSKSMSSGESKPQGSGSGGVFGRAMRGALKSIKDSMVYDDAKC